MEKTMLTCEQVAERYGVNTTTVWAWIHAGKLTACKIGRIYRVHPDDLEAFDAANRTAGH